MRNIQPIIDSITLHKPQLEHITGDVFGIANRIRDIDDGFFVVRNRISGKYEVHNVDTFHSYEFTVPYDELDSRTLDVCLKTRVENYKKLIAEMEKNNAKIDEEKQNKFHNEVESRAIELANDLRRLI